jgi:EAL domain-containing protein (putative c-di-GMP-specific phosphodiesterase class I)/DNA-binding response OmpR family regulator
VADDSAVNREVAVEALSRLGVTVELVETGLEAVHAVKTKAFDIVLMDGSMPEMDGFEAARHIRIWEGEAGREQVPIVALTAHVVGAAAEEWRAAGMNDIVYKPFSIRSLANCMSRLLGTSERAVESSAIPSSRSDLMCETSGDVAPSPHVPLLDEETTSQLRDMAERGQSDFVQRVFKLYLEHGPAGYEELALAVKDHDAERAARAAHALKSMSLNIGASRMAAVAAEIEREARQSGTLLVGKSDELSAILAATLQEIDTRLVAGWVGPTAASPTAANPPPVTQPAGKLQAALANNEFEVVYQPVVSRTGGETVGVEALVRWIGGAAPSEFIPLAESTGEICDLGAWVLRRACEEAAAWPHLSLAVNVSPVQLQEEHFSHVVESILKETGFPPHRLELEITETALLRNESKALAVIKRLRAQGIAFSLDDFGTGFSSLTYLRALPVDKIKIDRSFVTNVHETVDAATIVHAVVSIGRALGKKVVAEGVDTVEQQHFLSAAGVHLLQGYLFAKPMPADRLSEWLVQKAPKEVAC